MHEASDKCDDGGSTHFYQVEHDNVRLIDLIEEIGLLDEDQ